MYQKNEEKISDLQKTMIEFFENQEYAITNENFDENDVNFIFATENLFQYIIDTFHHEDYVEDPLPVEIVDFRITNKNFPIHRKAVLSIIVHDEDGSASFKYDFTYSYNHKLCDQVVYMIETKIDDLEVDY